MKILLTGATGFIGKHLLIALAAAGHELVGVVRQSGLPPQPRVSYIRMEFSQQLQPSDWSVALDDIDVVINAVGIFRETPGQSFEAIHRAAPVALFTAASNAGVRHIVQISALGADSTAPTRFLASKKAADDVLMSLPVQASIAQPSLVYGPGGTSAALFELLASMPLIPLPGHGQQQIQPVHIDDLVEAVVALVNAPSAPSRRIPMVGPVALSLRSFYSELRTAMSLTRSARFLPIPMGVMRLMARLGRWLPVGLLDADSLAMLERGNTASAAAIGLLLGRPPKPVSQFVPAPYALAVSTRARMRWLLPILRLSIAIVWIFTGIVSLGVYPVASSYELLARVGTPPALMPLSLYGAGLLDLALGFLTLRSRPPRWLWVVQAGLVLIYTIIISVKIPEFWLHPYGPILKNLPFLAGLWMLYELEDRAWNT